MSKTVAEQRARQDLGVGGSLELVGRTEAARIVGVNPVNLLAMRDFPAPVVDYLLCGKLWLRSDVERFAHGRGERLASR